MSPGADAGDGRWVGRALGVVVVALAAAALAPAVWASHQFDDVPDEHQFHDAVDWLADQGLTKGCNPPDNDLYCIDDPVTRGQMAVFVARAYSLPPETADHFGDDTGRFYESSANRLFERSWTFGCGGPNFCGDRPITRGEAAAILSRAAGLPPTSVDHFMDDDGSLFEVAINKIAEAGITKGCNPPVNDRYCPDDLLTRGQIAAFLKRSLEDTTPSPSSTTTTTQSTTTTTASTTTTTTIPSPTAVDDTASVLEDLAATTIDVLANDLDPGAVGIIVDSVTQPANGTVAVTNGGADLAYQPDADYCNDPPGTTPDTFTYTLTPGGSTATVSVTVTCVPDTPTAVDDIATVLEDSAATTIDVVANDLDPDPQGVTVDTVTQPANGTVAVTNGGADLAYQPDADYCNDPPGNTLDTFTYTLTPGGSTATVSVTVTCVNDSPVFTAGPDQTGVANQNPDGSAAGHTIDPWATGVSSGPGNESGQTVDFVIDSVTPSNLFTVQPSVSSSGVLTFTTNPATSGTATVTFHLHDDGGTANGGVDASATQSFTIETIFPPPVAVDDTYTATGNVEIDVSDTAEGVLQRGTDDLLFGATITQCGETSATLVDVSAGTCTTTSASGGSVVVNADGTFTYNPPAGFTGTDHFFYRLANGSDSDVGDVSITVNDMIWFVDNDAAGCTTLASGCGRLTDPFSTLAAFQTVNSGAAPNPQPGDTVFIHSGASPYLNGVTLRDDQSLIGQGAGASIETISGITLAPFSSPLPATSGTRPSLTTATATTNAITLGSDNTVRGLDIGNKTASGVAGANFGTLTLAEVDVTGSGQAISLNAGTANTSFGTLSSTSGTNAIALTNISGSITATGGALTGSSGDVLLVSGGNGSLTYPGTINNTGSNRAVNITGKTGGTTTLSGTVTDTTGIGDGISLTNNTGATTNLTGGIQLSTGAVVAFTATGGGTITATDPNSQGTAPDNTLTTTTGTALTVANTTIGASGLNFLSISANGAPNGIVLTNTGTSGRLVVAGDGDGNPDAGGGTIQNTTSHGIHVTGPVLGPNLTDVSVVNAGDADNEYGLFLTNVSGTTTLDDATLNGAADNLIYLTSSNVNATFNVSGSVFSYPAAIGGSANSAILLEPGGTSSLTASVTGSTFTNIVSAATQIGANTAGASGNLSLTFTGNTVNSVLSGRAGGVVVSGQENTTTNITIGTATAPNTFNGAGGNGVISIDVNDASVVTGTIANNNINDPPGIGIFSAVDEGATSTLTFNANTVTNSGGDGFQLVNFGGVGTSTMNATVTNNTINGHSLDAGVNFVGGISVTGFEDVLDLQLTGNSVTATPTGATQCGGALCVDYYLEEVAGTFRLEEIPDTVATTATQAFVNATNDAGPVTIFGIIDLSNGVEISSG